MRINTNIAALNSYNQLKNTQSNLSKSLSRLSSGKRINGAADDAAGLAISEKMKSQINGLGQAQRNAQDGISMIQTAEGALKESHSILQRMRELAVQSANDTNTKADREEIQKEVDQLAQELTRIGESTEFNTQKLLDGTLDSTKFQIGANEGQNMEISINDMQAEALGVAGAEGVQTEVTSSNLTAVASDEGGAGADGGEIFGAFGSSSSSTTHDNAPTTVTAGQLGEEISITDGTNTIDAKYALYNENNEVLAVSEDGQTYTALESATAEDSLTTSTGLLESAANTLSQFDFGADTTVTSGEVTMNFTETTSTGADTLSLTAEAGTVAFDSSENTLASGEYTVVGSAHPSVTNFGLVDSNDELVALSSDGQDWNDMFGNDLFDIATAGDALIADDTISIASSGGLDVSSQEAANNAISTLDTAIKDVSAERSKLGAVQNRLDHTINNLNTAEENLTAAESRISDVDMAKEMMNMSKQQILSQAGTAMMAQANQLPQGVLQLLG